MEPSSSVPVFIAAHLDSLAFKYDKEETGHRLVSHTTATQMYTPASSSAQGHRSACAAKPSSSSLLWRSPSEFIIFHNSVMHHGSDVHAPSYYLTTL